MSNRINNMQNFDNLFYDIFSEVLPIKNTPDVSLYKTDNGFAFDLEVPGIKKEELEVKVENASIKLSSIELPNKVNKKLKKHFSYVVQLPEGTFEEQITAKLEDGILTINLPGKTPIKTSRTIKIE